MVYAHECPTVVTKCASLSLSLSLSLSQGAVNDLEGTSYLSQSLPFGGCKFTGFGRFAGPEGLRGLSRTKAVVEDRFLLSGGTLMPYPPEVSPAPSPHRPCETRPQFVAIRRGWVGSGAAAAAPPAAPPGRGAVPGGP